MGLIGDMRDAPLTQPTSEGGNLPVWVLGHVTRAESDLLDVLILGKANRFSEVERMFAMKAEPTDDAAD